MKIIDLLSLKGRDPLFIGLIKMAFSIIIVPLLFLIIFTFYTIIEFRHYWLYLRSSQAHKPKPLIVKQEGSLVQVRSPNECICGRTSPPRSIMEAIEHIIQKSSGLLGL